MCASRRLTFVLLLAFSALPPGSARAQAAADPQTLLDALRGARLDPAAAVEVSGLRLDAGPGQLRIEEGYLFPVAPVAPPARGTTAAGRRSSRATTRWT
jgi:hypothetical protein